MDINEATIWWQDLTERRKKQMAEEYYWTTPERLSQASIEFIYLKEYNRY